MHKRTSYASKWNKQMFISLNANPNSEILYYTELKPAMSNFVPVNRKSNRSFQLTSDEYVDVLLIYKNRRKNRNNAEDRTECVFQIVKLIYRTRYFQSRKFASNST
ncbi:hypothetical protein JTB14_013281 [Gonioctena quinquepunctata]|nr:hypothetical protein JTB14_013281 [Gonioctena quinquepunctata]